MSTKAVYSNQGAFTGLGGTIMQVATIQPIIPLPSFLLAGHTVWKIMPSVLEVFLIYLFIFYEFLSCISLFL